MSDVRSRVLTRIRVRQAMEFATPHALKEYLHDHPGADPANHSVKPHEETQGEPEATPSETKQEAKPSEGSDALPPITFKQPLFTPEETNLPKVIKQSTDDPVKLFAEAKVAHEQQLDMLNHGNGIDKDIGATVVRGDKGEKPDFSKPGPIVVIGPMKEMERSKEKVDTDYAGHWSRLGDAVRASVAVDSLDDIPTVMAALRKHGLKLARTPTDRFQAPPPSGYRDMMMNVVQKNGHVSEIQIHLKAILQAKHEGHTIYAGVRTIEARAKAQNRTALTPEEQKIVDEANRKSRILYGAALASATKSPSTPKTAAERVLARVTVATAHMYYSWNGLPAEWAPPKFPRVYTLSGTERTVYELEKFFNEAQPITKAQHDALKDHINDESD
jgi:hypothetical protein